MSTIDLLNKIKNQETTCEENIAKKIETINKKEKEVRSFIDVFSEEALEKARQLDKKIKNGEKVGKLAGLAIAIKNNLCIKGKRATCASKILENYTAPYNATVIEKILNEDVIIIGTANMDEFACGSDTTKSAFYPTRNPINLDLVPGGSSGGSAATVAAGMADLALGTDTGGSVRCPASFCGVVGLKSTYGTVSRFGLIDMGMSLEQVGVLSNDAEGAALLLSVIAGKDERDSISINSDLNSIKPDLSNNLEKLTIGIPKEFFDGVDEKIGELIKEKIKVFEKHGASLTEVSIPHIKYAVPMYYLVDFAEFSSAMQKYDGLRYGFRADVNESLIASVSNVRGASLGKEVKRRILLGTYITMKEFRDAWYTKTLKARSLLRKEFLRVFEKCDLLAGPAMPTLPWKIGEKTSNPVESYLADILTSSANLVGIPAGVTNAGFLNNLPVGIQIHGNYLAEKTVLNALSILQKNKQ
ncbi:Asp-tRNA(Asn)/Glu-tRNA(Gln) amidotransferase subunit GatA [Candidatus Micrarchaeota archaeon]|nr:Asp-tRNA(Asn)/Glu-tRNA(Gln) amidotransferase subunit GatA [Candidatus Micrarchaeota archaeon]